MRWSDDGYFCQRMKEEKKLPLEKVGDIWFILLFVWLADLQKHKIVGTFLPITQLCNCKLSLGASRAIVRLKKKCCDFLNQYPFKRAGIDY